MIVSHQRPPQLEMPCLKPISELDHSSRDLPRGIFSNASLVPRKKMVSVFVGSLLTVLMVLTCLSVVVDGALAIPWTVCSVQSGISFAQFFEKLKAGSIDLFQSYAGKLQQSELSQASIAKSCMFWVHPVPLDFIDFNFRLYNYVALDTLLLSSQVTPQLPGWQMILKVGWQALQRQSQAALAISLLFRGRWRGGFLQACKCQMDQKSLVSSPSTVEPHLSAPELSSCSHYPTLIYSN